MTAWPVGEQDPKTRLRDLEAMLDAAVDYEVIKLDEAGNVVTWSRGAEAVQGYSADEVLGRPAAIFYTEEDQAAGLANRGLAAARETGRFEFEGWRVRKDGTRFWASVVLAPIRDGTGAVAGFTEVASDVGDRKRDDAMFRELLEAAPDAIVIVGPDGRISLANRQTDLLFGYDREELIGKKVEILVPERFRQRHPDHRNRYFSPGIRQSRGVCCAWSAGVRGPGVGACGRGVGRCGGSPR
jgi:PAS domain S-box-containing protein